MEIDAAHFAIHVRMVRVISLIFSPRALQMMRWLAVANCTLCCCLLLFLHISYVGKAECLPKLLVNQTDYHILQIKISSLWTKFSEELQTSNSGQLSPLFMSSRSTINLGDMLYRSLSLDSIYGSDTKNEEQKEDGANSEDATNIQKIENNNENNENKENNNVINNEINQNINENNNNNKNTNPNNNENTNKKNNNNNNNKKTKKSLFWADLMLEELTMWQDPVFVYAREKGYLYLSSKRREEHGVRTLNVTLNSDDPCLAPGHLLLEAFVGYDTVILNNIVGTLGGKGYAYNKQTYEYWSLNYLVYESGTIEFSAYALWKLEVLCRSLVLFVVSATLVSFCMKHIQTHVFHFTMQMRNQSLLRSSLVPVIVTHLIESSVLILVMVGVLLCVSEFMADRTISLLVLFLMWFTELFTLLAIRTEASLRYFPRFVMCCFLLFYLYLFSYPLGFHYIAYLCLCFSIEVLIVYFYIQHEMPAIQNGTINYSRTRAIPIIMNNNNSGNPRVLFRVQRVVQQQQQAPLPAVHPHAD